MIKAFFAWFGWAITLLLLMGCQAESGVTEMEMKELDESVQLFFELSEEENGAYVYYKGSNEMYVMLNGKNVEDDQNGISYTHFDVEVIEDTVNLHFTEDEALDDEEQLDQVIYKVIENSDYTTVRLYRNGEASHFAGASGEQVE